MSATVAIIDYGSGNLHSAQKAFERAARESGIDARILLTKEPDVVAQADRIVLPGVGAFADCKAGLIARAGMVEAMERRVLEQGRPFLGICVGMQLLAARGREHDVCDGLGWIGGEARRIEPDAPGLKIPHIGWNTLDLDASHPLFAGIPTGADGWHAYFVHSYHLADPPEGTRLASVDHGGPATAAVARGPVAGAQFHPEKSQRLGLAFIANFLRWRP